MTEVEAGLSCPPVPLLIPSPSHHCAKGITYTLDMLSGGLVVRSWR